MSEAGMLLKAYYELLYEKLAGCRPILVEKTGKILSEEITRQDVKDFNDEKYAAYKEASIAFIDERIEAYNPTGIQYTFDNINRRQVYELELQLDWYDSREEFSELLEAVKEKAESGMSDERTRELADELAKEFGAFPDRSIIRGYEGTPELAKLPDYVAAQAIEEVIR